MAAIAKLLCLCWT